jgi:hypothetical protein
VQIVNVIPGIEWWVFHRGPSSVRLRRLPRHPGFAAIVLLAAATGLFAAPATGPLRVHPTNPRYFTDGSGKAIYLTGSHTWANFMDRGPSNPPAAFDYSAYLEFLRKHHHNFIRLWTHELFNEEDAGGDADPVGYAAPLPWQRTGPGNAWDGKPKFDPILMDALEPLSNFEGVRKAIKPGDRLKALNLAEARRESARRAMGQTLTYASRINLAAMYPRDDLASTSCCLADPGKEYLVYQPRSEEFWVDLPSGIYRREWFNPAKGEGTDVGRIEVKGGKVQFNPPFKNDAVLYLKAQ